MTITRRGLLQWVLGGIAAVCLRRQAHASNMATVQVAFPDGTTFRFNVDDIELPSVPPIDWERESNTRIGLPQRGYLRLRVSGPIRHN